MWGRGKRSGPSKPEGPQPLRDAMREARIEAAERTGVVVDLRDAEVARLELVNLRVLRRAIKDRLNLPPLEMPPPLVPPTPEVLRKRIEGLLDAYGAIQPGGKSTAALERTFALAQDDTPRLRLQRPPLRLEIEPQRGLVRECRDWHVIEHRLTGDTIVPRTQCRWALR